MSNSVSYRDHRATSRVVLLLAIGLLVAFSPSRAVGQDRPTVETMRSWLHEPGVGLVLAPTDVASCPGNVPIGSEPLKINYEVTTTSTTPVQYTATFVYSNATLDGVVTSDTHGNPTPVVDGGSTTYTVSGTLSNTSPFRVDVVTTAIAAGPATTDWEVRRGAAVTTEEHCAFNVLAKMYTMSVTSQPSGVSIGIEADGNDEGMATTPFSRAFPESTMVALIAPGSFNGIPFTEWQNGSTVTDPRYEVTLTGNAGVAAIYGQPAISDLALGLEDVRGSLAFDSVSAAARIAIDSLVVLVFAVRNDGPDEANSVVVSGGVDPNFFALQNVALDPVISSCSFSPAGGFFSCGGLTIAPGDTLRVAATGTGIAETSGTGFSASTGNPDDPDFGNNDVGVTLTIETATQTGSATGFSFLDLDGDGIRQVGEPGLADRMIYNDLNSNTTYDPGTDLAVMTDTNGMFLFVNLSFPATVGEVIPAGWEGTYPLGGVHTITEDGQEANFGSRPLGGAIVGSKWDDSDGDGEVDELERYLSGWTVYLDANNNGQLDGTEQSGVTGGNGIVSFTNLGPGDYIVREVQQDGFVQTFPGGDELHVVTILGDEIARVNFGNRKAGAVHGFVFDDVNGNGERDEGEPPLNGATIQLWTRLGPGVEGELVATTTSMSMDVDGDGQISELTETGLYWIENIKAGLYELRIEPGAGQRQSHPGYQETGLLNGQVVRAGSYHLSLIPGERLDDIPFGVTALSLITGTTYLDILGDGRIDELDPHDIVGATVELVDARTGVVVDTARTEPLAAGNFPVGTYRFWVPPGEYIVRLKDPTYQSYPVGGPHRLTVSAPGTVHMRDFSQTRPFTISGSKYGDTNGNRLVDSGETKLGGWTIRLSGRSRVGAPVDREFTTEASGEFEFSDIPPGIYVVDEEMQGGFRQTFPPTGDHFFSTSGYRSRLRALDFANQPVDETTITDSGDGEGLHDAIGACNAKSEEDPPCGIDFIVLGAHAKRSGTIRLSRPLPPLTHPIIIDGGGTLVIDGTDAGDQADGLVINGGSTDITGVTLTGFSGHGILIEGSGNNRVRGATIMGNGGDGIRIVSSTNNMIGGSVLFGNGQLAIDIGGDGATANDIDEADGIQNYPIIDAVRSDTGLVVEGTFTGLADSLHVLEFFATPSCRASGTGQGVGGGMIYLGKARVFTDSLGTAAFSVRFDTTFAVRSFVTATATNSAGATSEFSPCGPQVATGVEEQARSDNAAAATFRLLGNYPNPFASSTMIRFDAPTTMRVRLTVFDVLGREVAILADDEVAPGIHEVAFESRGLSPGVYLYRLEADSFSATRSMVIR